ncbi:hypothetical protein DASC09_021560 [Saccharomycopsis crataegensis]|uniref:Uncharacterized protein n=1 Tax=Saccharomycopsis crataegensis TaxID=43959 RepID=A0AAV5QJN3_9ASCO|nr:hypothetical protein DASC09_021560 [Saccharomycopsis crataegensis]
MLVVNYDFNMTTSNFPNNNNSTNNNNNNNSGQNMMFGLPKINTSCLKNSYNSTKEIQLNSAGSSLFPEINTSQFDPLSNNYVPLAPSIPPTGSKKSKRKH